MISTNKVLITCIIGVVIGIGTLVPCARILSKSINENKYYKWSVCTTTNITDACLVEPTKETSYTDCLISVTFIVDQVVYDGSLKDPGLSSGKEYYTAEKHPIGSSYPCLYDSDHFKSKEIVITLTSPPPIDPTILGILTGATFILGSILFYPLIVWVNTKHFASFVIPSNWQNRISTQGDTIGYSSGVLFTTADMIIGKGALTSSIPFLYFNSFGLIFFTCISVGFLCPTFFSFAFFTSKTRRSDTDYLDDLERGASFFLYGIVMTVACGITMIFLTFSLIFIDIWTSPSVYICLLCFGIYIVYSRILHMFWLTDHLNIVLSPEEGDVHRQTRDSCSCFGTHWIMAIFALYQLFVSPIFMAVSPNTNGWGFFTVFGGAGSLYIKMFQGYIWFPKVFPYVVPLNIVSIVAQMIVLGYYRHELTSGYLCILFSFVICEIMAIVIASFVNNKHKSKNMYNRL